MKLGEGSTTVISFLHPSNRHASERRPLRRLALGLSAGLLFVVSACGFDAQTLSPYTPGSGVNVNVGGGPNGQPVASTVQVRGLMVISDQAGDGYLGGSLYTENSDSLTAVTGYAVKADGSHGSTITAVLSTPITVANSQLVVLTDQTRITMTSADLAPGLSADLTLTFAHAGSQQVLVPVVDGAIPPYNQIASPTPSAPPSS